MKKELLPNPFDPARAARDTFVGRKKLLQQLVDGLTDGKSYALVGPPGIGKSNLMLELQLRIASKQSFPRFSLRPLPIYLDFKRDDNNTGQIFSRIEAGIADQFAQQYGQICPSDIRSRARDSLDSNSFEGALHIILSWAHSKSGLSYRPILLLDAAHRLADDQLLAALLAAFNSPADKKIISVLLSSRQLFTKELCNSASPFKLLTQQHELLPLDREESKSLIALASRKGWLVDPDFAEQFYRIAAGHPYRSQYYLQAIAADSRTISSNALLALHNQATIEFLNNILVVPPRTSAPHTSSTIFVSYSHKDETEKKQLMTHLNVLGNDFPAKAWCDDCISPGANWKAEVNQAIDNAKVAILLITANSLTSRVILDFEIPRIQSRREKTIFFPISGRKCPWPEWLAAQNIRPKNGTPIWKDGELKADEFLTDIVNEIARILSKKNIA